MIDKIDLSGEWKLYLDDSSSEVFPEFNDSIILPDTTSHACKGRPNTRCETGFLTDTYLFEGNAWFSRIIDFGNRNGRITKLFLERTRITTLFVDGIKIGRCENLCTPHVYDLTELALQGEHEITICVSNVGYKTSGGHMTSPDTQTNWNGITGRIELQFFDNTHLENVMIYADIIAKEFRITANVIGNREGEVEISATSFNGSVKHSPEVIVIPFSNGRLDVRFPLGNEALLWDEHEPNLYQVKIRIGDEIYCAVAGLREFKAEGNKFTVNGKKTFLRGKHDGMIFPKTGYAPTTVEEWLSVMSTAKEYGINHYRFHTCCPPEAAFLAADMLGLYMEPELPFWGTITEKSDEGHNEQQQQYLIAEGFGILQEYGNHPSFCMMSLGNELWGSKEILNDILAQYKAFDSRHLYTQGSNNFQWWPCVLDNDDFFVGVRLSKDRLLRGSYAMCDAPLGHIQAEKPSTLKDYDGAVWCREGRQENKSGHIQIQYGTGVRVVKSVEDEAELCPQIPIITHEIGQFQTYPNFNEIKKYTGSLKARNFEIFRQRLVQNGMEQMERDFFECSGALAAQCYKEELESALRSQSLAGFQLLDLQDFSGQGTALVGMLDAFMDSKGIITPEKWCESCNNVVLLAKFKAYTYEAGDNFSSCLMLVNFSNISFGGKRVNWEITAASGERLFSGSFVVESENEQNYVEIGQINLNFPKVETAEALTLSISVYGTEINNSYEIYVYPKIAANALKSEHLFTKIDSRAEALLSQNKKILLMQLPEKGIQGCYCTDFWCYPMFHSISEKMDKPEPIGTLGMVIDEAHSALSGFPCKRYSTPQWWEIAESSRPEILDGNFADKKLIIQTIDNFERNHCLGLLYEYEHLGGRVLVCNCDYDRLLQSCEGRQFIKSLIEYAEG